MVLSDTVAEEEEIKGKAQPCSYVIGMHWNPSGFFPDHIHQLNMLGSAGTIMDSVITTWDAVRDVRGIS